MPTEQGAVTSKAEQTRAAQGWTEQSRSEAEQEQFQGETSVEGRCAEGRRACLCNSRVHTLGGSLGVTRHLHQDVSLCLQQHLSYHFCHLHHAAQQLLKAQFEDGKLFEKFFESYVHPHDQQASIKLPYAMWAMPDSKKLVGRAN